MTGHVPDGRRIRELRRARCLTQAELAAELGIGQSAISLIENGRTSRPQCLAGLAAFFGLRAQDLLVPPVPGNAAASTPPAQDPPFWTVAEAVAVLGVSKKIVYRLARAGALEAQRAGRSWRITAASLRACQASPARAALNPPPVQQRPGLVPVDKARLRELRKAQGWTQQQLAHTAGLSLSSVGALETGHYTRTSAIPALAQALGTTPADLTAAPPGEPVIRPAGPLPPGGAARTAAPPPWHAEGAALRALRAGRGLTQAELAGRAGLSRPLLSLLERGYGYRPGLILALARALGLPPAQLAPPAPATDPGSGARRSRSQAPGQRAPAGLISPSLKEHDER
jgi:excisionase family DNA binding protein